YARWQSVFDYW
nr:immunoglobulin heavy chain junction region [Macaca mulatta]